MHRCVKYSITLSVPGVQRQCCLKHWICSFFMTYISNSACSSPLLSASLARPSACACVGVGGGSYCYIRNNYCTSLERIFFFHKLTFICIYFKEMLVLLMCSILSKKCSFLWVLYNLKCSFLWVLYNSSYKLTSTRLESA